MIGRMEGWKNSYWERRVDGWKVGRIDEWKVGRMEEWMGGWMEEWKGEIRIKGV